MHVAFWSPAWPLERHPNGIVTYVTAVKRELERRGHRVSVFTADLHEAAGNESVFRVDLSKWNRFMSRIRGNAAVSDVSFGLARAIMSVHRRCPIDIVEMEESFGWFGEVQRATSLPVIVKLHGPAFLTTVEPDRDRPFVRERIVREGQALARCAVIVSPSRVNLMRTLEEYRLSGKPTRIIPNPVVLDENVPTWTLRGCDSRTILFVGRFDLVKGGDVMLKAFSSVLKTFPDAKLIFAGPDGGWLSSEGRRIQLNSYCESALPPAARRSVDYRGRVPHGQLAALRASAMVTVVASRWESQPYAMLEAMAQGCPMVSTDAGACPESIIHGTTGFLARSEDPEDFAEKICGVLRDPVAASAMGRAARKHVLQHHSASGVVDAMLDCYEWTIAKHRSNARGMSGG